MAVRRRKIVGSKGPNEKLLGLSLEDWQAITTSFQEAIAEKEQARSITLTGVPSSNLYCLGHDANAAEKWITRTFYKGDKFNIIGIRVTTKSGLLLMMRPGQMGSEERAQDLVANDVSKIEADLTKTRELFGDQFDRVWVTLMGSTFEESLRTIKEGPDLDDEGEVVPGPVLPEAAADDTWGSW